MNIEVEIHHLFPTILYSSKIPEVTKDEMNHIENLEYELMTSKNGKYSLNKHILKDPALSRIESEIQRHCDLYTKEILQVSLNVEFYIKTSWSVLHNHEDWAQPHVHTNSLISGILYTKVHENCGDIIFYRNSAQHVFPPAIHIDFRNLNQLNGEVFSVTPKNNMILLFPSSLTHSVTINNSNEDRYSIAFDIFVRGSVGRDEFQLYLP
jgi:uncharacterized protein (TIGR02466 family)